MGLEVPQENSCSSPFRVQGPEKGRGLPEVTQSGGTGTGPGPLGNQTVVLRLCQELCCFLFLVICDKLVSLEEWKEEA